MVNILTGKDLVGYYVDEAGVEGTTPTNASWIALAQHTRINPAYEPNLNAVRQSGSVDLAALALGVFKPSVSIDMLPVTSTFLRAYLSTDSTFSLIVKDITNTSMFLLYKGCKFASTKMSARVYPSTTPFMATHNIEATDIVVQATDPSPGVPSYGAIPTGVLNWSGISISKGITAYTDWHSFDMTVTNVLKRLPNVTTGKTRTLKRLTRELTGTLIRDFSDLAEYTDIVTPTTFSAVLGLDAGHSVTFNSSQWTNFNPPSNVEDLVEKSTPFKGLTLTSA